MKLLLTSAAVFSLFLAISCSKGTSGPNAGAGTSSLFPLTQGNTWYYVDSAFSDSVVLAAYLDTMTVTKETFTDQSNTVYLGLNDPNGWFFGSFIAVDPTNKAIYEVDSPAYSPYTFFAAASQDDQLIGSGSEQVTPGCAFSTTQFGFVTPVMINGFSCLTNIEKTVDCNNIPQEEIDSYVSAGTGVVRIVHYLPDSTSGGPLHEDYSQTLISAVIKK